MARRSARPAGLGNRRHPGRHTGHRARRTVRRPRRHRRQRGCGRVLGVDDHDPRGGRFHHHDDVAHPGADQFRRGQGRSHRGPDRPAADRTRPGHRGLRPVDRRRGRHQVGAGGDLRIAGYRAGQARRGPGRAPQRRHPVLRGRDRLRGGRPPVRRAERQRPDPEPLRAPRPRRPLPGGGDRAVGPAGPVRHPGQAAGRGAEPAGPDRRRRPRRAAGVRRRRAVPGHPRPGEGHDRPGDRPAGRGSRPPPRRPARPAPRPPPTGRRRPHRPPRPPRSPAPSAAAAPPPPVPTSRPTRRAAGPR